LKHLPPKNVDRHQALATPVAMVSEKKNLGHGNPSCATAPFFGFGAAARLRMTWRRIAFE